MEHDAQSPEGGSGGTDHGSEPVSFFSECITRIVPRTAGGTDWDSSGTGRYLVPPKEGWDVLSMHDDNPDTFRHPHPIAAAAATAAVSHIGAASIN